MNMIEAKKMVFRHLAIRLETSRFDFVNDFDEADQKRINRAIDDIIDEFYRRGESKRTR